MSAYRIYKLDGDGRFSTAEWIQADDDDLAITAARASMQQHSFELWQGNKLVAQINGSPASAGHSGSSSSSK